MTQHNIHTDVIADRFAAMAKAHGDVPAVIDGDPTYTYARLLLLSDTILSNAPMIRPGDRVGIVMNHGVRMIASILAVLRRGAAYVPAEPSFPRERINYMMRESGVELIIADAEHATLPGEGFTVYVPGNLSDNETQGRRPAIDAHVCPADTAYILYTSGTTGRPKGVVVTNGNVCHYARAFDNEFHLRPGTDRVMQYSVCSFDIFVEEVFGTLLNGATLVIPPADIHDNIPALMKYAAEKEVTVISGFPYLMLELNRLHRLPQSLRLLISGGDVLRASYVDRIIDTGIDVYNTYGPSETTVCATYFRCNGTQPLENGTYPIGTPVKDVGVEIIGADGKPVADGAPGQIVISGNGVSAGYVTRCPESENFATGSDGRPIYLSGDLGYRLPDGNIAFIRRIDHQVMILGKRVECAEVENVLCSCPGVEYGTVVAHDDPDSLAYLTAYFTVADSGLKLDTIMRYMAQYLAPFMIPEFFVEMRQMPLNPSGKIDRRALPLVMKQGAVTERTKRDAS